MSNKNQLQTNNTTLDAYISRINTAKETASNLQSVTKVQQATPSIAVNDMGLITASVTQTAGYVPSGTKTTTEQLPIQTAQTIVPGTTDKVISAGKYITGDQIIKGDTNLIADNIKSGISIFGVNGTCGGNDSGSGSGTSINTSNVTIEYISGVLAFIDICYTHLNDNGELICEIVSAPDGYSTGNITMSLENVVCNSLFTIRAEGISDYENAAFVMDNIQHIVCESYLRAFYPINPGNSTLTITCEM